ncbi:uncharacterized protein LOC103579563 [Microplitis demolitor]|uniref:uncharacterized protein LOC103579563 n=1 Tax=Microplitis demolitor TaxID=69319 RepID=UPI0004CCCB5C|nr:uncharacterized protein LOC103579563 [Microplitis demolitor]
MPTIHIVKKLFHNYIMDVPELFRSINLWSFVWETIGNASMAYDITSNWNGTKSNDDNEFNLFENPAKLGILTGLLIALYAESEFFPAKFDNYIESKLKNIAFMILNISFFLIIAPFIAAALTVFFIYRQIIKLILKITMGRKFAGLLEGTDCVWAIEDSSALSVINVLGVLELDSLSTNSVNIIEDFRTLIKNRLLSKNYDKLFWAREKKYGYWFWKISDDINLKERVRWLDIDHNKCNGTCNDVYGGYLKEIISRVSNKPLPENHSAGWEILIGQNCQSYEFQKVDEDINNIELKRTVTLVFRVHHCLGDGVALLRLLLERKMLKIITALILIPNCLWRQACLSMDDSALHGPALSGDKKISCWMEEDFKDNQNDSLLAKIRDIKNLTGTRFSDVILASLSANMHKYFWKIGETAPKNLTVVIPTRMTAPSQKLTFKNRFSVGLLPLCISEVNGIYCGHPADDPRKLLDRLRDVSKSYRKLRSDSDYLVNYWVMTWLSAALPEALLRPFLKSHSTMVFSNLPGPQAVAILGHTLKKISFWIPHRGTTGIGFSFLTYDSNVHLSLIADEALVTEGMNLDDILKGTVNDIKRLHDNITLPCFAKSYLNNADAPMEIDFGVQ